MSFGVLLDRGMPWQWRKWNAVYIQAWFVLGSSSCLTLKTADELVDWLFSLRDTGTQLSKNQGVCWIGLPLRDGWRVWDISLCSETPWCFSPHWLAQNDKQCYLYELWFWWCLMFFFSYRNKSQHSWIDLLNNNDNSNDIYNDDINKWEWDIFSVFTFVFHQIKWNKGIFYNVSRTRSTAFEFCFPQLLNTRHTKIQQCLKVGVSWHILVLKHGY